MEDGIIWSGSERAKVFNFSKEKYPVSYLWKEGNTIIISLINTSQSGKGYLSELFKNIEKKGYEIVTPTPLGKMVTILESKGFKPSMTNDGVELWRGRWTTSTQQ